jgi:hypothetical protein
LAFKSKSSESKIELIDLKEIQANMQSFEEKFLETIAKDYLSSTTPARKLLFQLRFDPKFHPQNVKEGLSNKQIYSMVKEQLSKGSSLPTGTDLKFLIRTVADAFETQMLQDGVDIEFLKSDEPGKDGKWQVVYDWLWQKYFPRWLLEQQWQELVAKADKVDDWLQVTPGERTLRMPEPRQSTIPLKTEVYLLVNLNWVNRFFLLLYQGTDGKKYCLCPSKGFAPSSELSEQKMYLPQRDAEELSMYFQDAGKEHFLGIVMEKPLDLLWLRPNAQEPVPSLGANRLNELWKNLEQQGDWQMFYKSFDVVG